MPSSFRWTLTKSFRALALEIRHPRSLVMSGGETSFYTSRVGEEGLSSTTMGETQREET